MVSELSDSYSKEPDSMQSFRGSLFMRSSLSALVLGVAAVSRHHRFIWKTRPRISSGSSMMAAISSSALSKGIL